MQRRAWGNMQRPASEVTTYRTSHKMRARRRCGAYTKCMCLLLLASTMVLSGCGGGSSTADSQQGAALSGNWQFTMTPPDPNYPLTAQYGFQGGFLLQKNGSVSGQAVYS